MTPEALPPPRKSRRELLLSWLRSPAATLVVGAMGVFGVLTLVLVAASDAVFFSSGSLAFIVAAGVTFLAVVTLVVFRVFLPAQYRPAADRREVEDELTPADRAMDALAARPGGLEAQAASTVSMLVEKFYVGRRIPRDEDDPIARMLDGALDTAALSEKDQDTLDAGLEPLWTFMTQQLRDGNAQLRGKAKAVMFAIELYRRTVQRYLNAKRGRT